MSTPNQLFTNNAVALLAAPISQIATSLTVMAGYGALYPQPVDPGDFFLVTLENQAGTAREIIRVNARVGDTFTDIERAQEGTTAYMWQVSLGNDTLVDHRVTAETMRQALLKPVATADLILQDEGVPLASATSAINFVGPNVTVTGNGPTKTVTIDTPAGTGSSIAGATTTAPISVDPAWTRSLSAVTYSQFQRGFKFFVTILMPSNFLSCTFEVLGNISGNLATNSETVTWNRTARVGYNFAGNINITLDKATKELNLVWTNGEANPVEVLCTRIQHLP